MKAAWHLTLALVAISLTAGCAASQVQHASTPAPRSYERVASWAQLPPGDAWQEMSGVDIDRAGNIYAFQRTPSRVMVFSASGQFLHSWGEGLFVGAHALRVDPKGNVWVTDKVLHQVMKFSRDGRLLLSLGTKGVAGDNNSRVSLNGPADIAFAPNGDIFVADGESANARVVRYSKEGQFLAYWGVKGSGPGELMTPHSIVMDSHGRLYVANRGNKRVEIFDQSGAYLGQITNAGTPYGLAITPDDVLYVADGTAGSEALTVVNTSNGNVLAHISGMTGAHAITVDRSGAIYVAEVRGRAVEKFTRTP